VVKPLRAVDQSLRRHRPVGVLDDLGDLVPVDRHVEVHAEPAAATDVRRHEKPLGIRRDHRPLHAGRRRARERQSIVVVVIGVRDERLLAPNEPRGLAVAQPLGGLREREADASQRGQRISDHARECD
jgi:hypothetical protein